METLFRRRAEHVDDLAHHEALPRRADLWMRDHVLAAGEPKQRMQNARVADEDLGRAHLPLADVLVPRLQLSHHEDGRQQVQVAPHRGMGDAEGAPEFGAVPNLPVPMREHRPKPPQRRGRHRTAKLRHVPCEEGLDEAIPPTPAGGLRTRQVGEREAAAQPKALQVGHLVQAQAIERVEPHAASKRLGRLLEQVRRRAAENQKPRRRTGPVRQHAKQRKDLRQALNLVEHHQAPQWPQLQPRIRQTRQIGRIFQVEPMRGPAPGGRELPRQGRLAYLPRTEDRNHRKLAQQQPHTAQMMFSVDVHCIEI